MEKRNKIIYWIATGLLSFGMLASGIQQLFQTKTMLDISSPLGYPPYFLSIIGVWKILAVIAILIPRFTLLKEWAYAGLFFVMTGAFVSHLAVGDDLKELIGPIMQTIFIILSWYFRPENRKIVPVNN
ncbi:MAG: DoxX family protein [Bacteroidota bacterium]|nr:DoxX family protein [Bacteroidota bacterium]